MEAANMVRPLAVTYENAPRRLARQSQFDNLRVELFNRALEAGEVPDIYVELHKKDRRRAHMEYFNFCCRTYQGFRENIDPDYLSFSTNGRRRPPPAVTNGPFDGYLSISGANPMKFVRGTTDGPTSRELNARFIPTKILVAERKRNLFLNRLLSPISDKFGEPSQNVHVEHGAAEAKKDLHPMCGCGSAWASCDKCIANGRQSEPFVPYSAPKLMNALRHDSGAATKALRTQLFARALEAGVIPLVYLELYKTDPHQARKEYFNFCCQTYENFRENIDSVFAQHKHIGEQILLAAQVAAKTRGYDLKWSEKDGWSVTCLRYGYTLHGAGRDHIKEYALSEAAKTLPQRMSGSPDGDIQWWFKNTGDYYEMVCEARTLEEIARAASAYQHDPKVRVYWGTADRLNAALESAEQMVLPGKSIERSLGTSDSFQAKIIAFPLVRQHKINLLAGRADG